MSEFKVAVGLCPLRPRSWLGCGRCGCWGLSDGFPQFVCIPAVSASLLPLLTRTPVRLDLVPAKWLHFNLATLKFLSPNTVQSNFGVLRARVSTVAHYPVSLLSI